MRPFVTPLFEVSTEVNFAMEAVAEFPARSFYAKIADRFPHVQQFPVFAVPPEQATPQQLEATPAIYRFSSADGIASIFIGPRMVAANTRAWNGYPEYRLFALEAIRLYLELAKPQRLIRQSLGFYNRIPVDGISDVQEIVSAPLDLRGDVQLFELVAQSARRTPAGSVLTQIVISQPDAFSPEPFLAINNIIRHVLAQEDHFSMESFSAWLDAAHEVGRDALWTVLSERAQNSWRAANAK